MTRDAAIQIAREFSARSGIKVGSVVRVTEPGQPDNSWCIVFQRVGNQHISPSSVIVEVEDANGNAQFFDSL